MMTRNILLALCHILLLLSCTPSVEDQIKEKVDALSEMTELGTVEYTVKKIIAVDDDVWYKYGDRKLMFSSVAYIKAGIDLSGFKPDDVRIDEESSTISVTFPKAKLLSFNMPMEEIRQEYARVTGFRFEFTPDERLNLKQQGEKSIREDIPNMGIIEEAEKNARDFFTAMFSQFGYGAIKVNFE